MSNREALTDMFYKYITYTPEYHGGTSLVNLRESIKADCFLRNPGRKPTNIQQWHEWFLSLQTITNE